ncbi:hypothetical protein F5141DRAFT_1203729 [Pisolithus sp. B1]|nr:hypothetical protein F5141DRAFT_1203729 [Pisolithus sp. B1]
MVSMSAFDTKLPSVPPYAPPSGPYRCFDAVCFTADRKATFLRTTQVETSTDRFAPMEPGYCAAAFGILFFFDFREIGLCISSSFGSARLLLILYREEKIDGNNRAYAKHGVGTNYRKVGGSCYVSCEIQWRRQALKLSVIKAPMYKLNGRIMGANLCQSDLRMCHTREETGGSSGSSHSLVNHGKIGEHQAHARLEMMQYGAICSYLESVPTRSVFIDAFGASESNGFIAAVTTFLRTVFHMSRRAKVRTTYDTSRFSITEIASVPPEKVLLAVGWVVAYPSGNGLMTPPLLLATAYCRGYPVQLELKLSHLRLYDGILGQEF